MACGGQDRMVKRTMEKKKSLDRAIDEDKEETNRKPTSREWVKWAGYDCGE